MFCHQLEGTYVAFPDVSTLDIPERVLAERLNAEFRVAVVSGTEQFITPGAKGHLKLSFATSRAVLKAGMARLATGLKQINQASHHNLISLFFRQESLDILI